MLNNMVIHDPKNDVLMVDIPQGWSDQAIEDNKYRYNPDCECVDCLEDTATQLEDAYLNSQMRVHLDSWYWD